MIRVVHPGSASRIRILFFYQSQARNQGSKRNRIPDPDPQHCLKYQSVCPIVGMGSPLPLPPLAIVSPPLDPEGGATLSCGGEGMGGGPIRTTGLKSLALCTMISVAETRQYQREVFRMMYLFCTSHFRGWQIHVQKFFI
jgi:hypothetical protein